MLKNLVRSVSLWHTHPTKTISGETSPPQTKLLITAKDPDKIFYGRVKTEITRGKSRRGMTSHNGKVNRNKTFGEYVLRVPTNCFEKPEVFM